MYNVKIINATTGKFEAFLSVNGRTEWKQLKRALNHAYDYFTKNENVIVKVQSCD